MTAPAKPTTPKKKPSRADAGSGATGSVSQFLLAHYQHMNARELKDAALAYKTFVEAGNLMLVTLAGAMSTAQLGKSLAPMIRAGKIGAISCTGANLEEDLFNLIGQKSYTPMPQYRDLTPDDEAALREKGQSRITDVAIDDDAVMKPVTELLLPLWKAASDSGQAKFPHEFLYELIRSGALASNYQGDPAESWMLAAAEKNLPIVCPGWEDSTLGNAFASACLRGDVEHSTAVRSGIEYMIWLAGWYATEAKGKEIGFFQIGGGIAGDFPICVVPVLHDELGRDDVPLWGYFAQITDAVCSYGGYSGATPNEKITWGKLAKETPSFAIESDATIVAPLIFAIVLGL